MKKACAIAALAGLASLQAVAQSTVTISGLLDIAPQRIVTSNGAALYKVTGSAFNASRIRFIGVEDLGDGLKAGFTLETQPGLDTGNPSVIGFWNRNAFVSLSSPAWGELRLGRHGTPTIAMICLVDQHFCGSGFNGSGLMYNGTNAFGRWISGNAGRGGNANEGMSVFSGGTGVAGTADSSRVNNSVTYLSPKVGGFWAHLLVAAGEQAKTAANGRGNHYGATLNFQAGPVYFGLGHEYVQRDPLWNAGGHISSISGMYTIGPLRVGAIYQDESAEGPAAKWTKARDWAVTATYRIDAFEPFVKVGMHRTNGAGAYAIVKGTDAQMLDTGSFYRLSRRTSLYVNYTKDFKGASGLAGNVRDPWQFSVGTQHNF